MSDLNNVDVLVVLGSSHDEEYLEGCVGTLKKLKLSYAVKVASAHRSPERVTQVLKEHANAKVIIALAGHASHLAGVIAAEVTKPVIAVPLPTSDLDGLDSLLATVQMPGGVPVATMAIGKAGSTNAACFAAQIISLIRPETAELWCAVKKEFARKVERSSQEVEQKWQQ